MNSLNVIRPYRYSALWVFDDPDKGLLREPFVAGTDILIDRATEHIPNADDGFTLIFSAQPFPGHQYRLEHRRRAVDSGAWYYSPEFELEGWLCPALFHYFEEAPDEIFIKVEPCRNPTT
jgi:hypothetical protein